MSSIKAIIIDIDGVLIPGDKWHQEAFILALSDFDISISKNFYIEKLGSLPTISKLRIITKTHDFSMDQAKVVNQRKQQYTKRIINSRLKRSQKLINLFRKLKKDGYKLACCSNSVRATVEKVLGKLGLTKEIEFYLCAEDCAPKPNPMIYIEAIKRFKIRSKEALILEDSKEGLKAARGSGGRVMKITNLRETNYKNIVNQILKY